MKRIIVEGISKEFRLGFRKNQPALARFISLFSGREPKRVLKVLDDVSFEVAPGQILGIIGENGSGKSTLLRIIAGIYCKDKGRIALNGNIISVIDLYTSLRVRLSMEDNIQLIGAFFGMSPKLLKERFAAIVEFTELKDFLNTKIYQFSNGMLQRLVFSIAVHADIDILLLDEIFEIGDEYFRLKIADEIGRLAKNGASVISVSHELGLIEKFCGRTIWLSKGRIAEDGDTRDIVGKYRATVLK